MVTRIPPPPPGIYEDVPFATYLSWSAVSNSQLGHLKRSPAHLKAVLDGGDADTDALAMGRAVHCAILEPERFARDVIRRVPGNGATKVVKEARAKQVLDHPAAEIVKAEDYDDCLAMRDAVMRTEKAGGAISLPGRTELSLVWVDADTGVTCKSRLDKHLDIDDGTIIDLKSTSDASEREFSRAIYVYGYHRQAAMYLDAAEALGLSVRHYAIIAVEKTRPYAVAPYRVTEGSIAAGRDELRRLMKRYAECVERDEWPGYPDRFIDIALPDWAWRQAADDAAQEAA